MGISTMLTKICW